MLGVLDAVRALGIAITPDSRLIVGGASVENSSNGPLSHPASSANLDVGALFDAEFAVRYGNTVPSMSDFALSFRGCRLSVYL